MNAIIKIIIGVLLLVSSVMYIYTNQYGAWRDFLTVFNGTVPAAAGLLGFFIIWLELDEMKVKKATNRRKKR